METNINNLLAISFCVSYTSKNVLTLKRAACLPDQNDGLVALDKLQELFPWSRCGKSRGQALKESVAHPHGRQGICKKKGLQVWSVLFTYIPLPRLASHAGSFWRLSKIS